jgi:DNA polymerase I
LPEINSPNGPRRGGAERAAINAPMQGTAADLIKLSMNKVQQVLDSEKRATTMIMQGTTNWFLRCLKRKSTGCEPKFRG